jgi:hypothetical protein
MQIGRAHGFLRQLATLTAAAAFLGSCGSHPEPTVTAVLPECIMVVDIHAARGQLLAAIAAAQQGQGTAAAAAASQARAAADSVSRRLQTLGAGAGAARNLRFAITSANIFVDQVAVIFEFPDALGPSSVGETARVAAQTRPMMDQVIGSLDSLALHGTDGGGGLCPDLALGPPLPTLPPSPTPSAGPVPPGSASEHATAALAGFQAQSGGRDRVHGTSSSPLAARGKPLHPVHEAHQSERL